MKDGKKLIITIGRQFGSGGSEIGRQLATELGLGFTTRISSAWIRMKAVSRKAFIT